MKLEYLILGLLEINPSTGYDIKKFMDTEGRFTNKRPPLSQIYTTLKKMVKKNWVRFEEEHREGKPDLKIYHNTEAGRQTFIDHLHSPLKLTFRYRESDIYMRVAFSFLVEPQVTLAHLKTELAYRTEQIAQFRNRDRTMHSDQLSKTTVENINELHEMLHLFGARAIDDYVESLKEMIQYFNGKTNIKN